MKVILGILLSLPAASCLMAQKSYEAPITIDNGLVNNEVTSIHQDKYGFLWFGTRGGLDRYNGYDFNLLRYQPGSGNNLTNQAVETIAEDRNHNLWIGTKNGGLNSYDLLKDSILHYHPPAEIRIQEIKALLVDDSGILYIGALHGLYCYEKGRFHRIEDSLPVNALQLAPGGKIWVGSTAGLLQYDPRGRQLKNIRLTGKNPNITSFAFCRQTQTLYMGSWSAGLLAYRLADGRVTRYDKSIGTGLTNNNAYRIYLDRSGMLWVGTWGGGLFRFNTGTGVFEAEQIKPDNVYNTDYDIVLSIVQDVTGILWIGTDGGGICKIDPFKKKFKTVTHLSDGNYGLPNTHVTAVFTDTTGALWLGTRGGGILYSPDKSRFFRRSRGTGGDIIRTFRQFDQKELWVGTTDGLLVFHDFYHNNFNPAWIKWGKDSNSLSGPKITSIVRDREGTVWIGTQEHGLNRIKGYQNGRPLFEKYPEQVGVKGALQNDRISCMLVDHKDRLWIGTYNGLHLYDRKRDDFIAFSHNEGDPNSISNNTILSLAEDQNGHIWVGTQQGINRLIWSTNRACTVDRYFQCPGFPNDYIHAVLVDGDNNVWMSTNNGITKFNPENGEFRNFDTRDGISSNTFSENAAYESPDGEMFFGGNAGLTYFYPDSIQLSRYHPAVYITKLEINNRNVAVDQPFSGKTLLHQSVFLTRQITLSYREDIISLSFSALDFHAPNKNQYLYQLVGFDKGWVMAGYRRNVTYTNLSPGSYTFRVRASNSDQIWDNKVREMKIVILPPPWKTWWAYGIYALIVLGLLGLSRSMTLGRIRLRNQLEIADLNYRKEHEIAEIKSKFFANISHEFRTPLTLIIGPLAGLAASEKVDARIRAILVKVQNQSSRLLSLVNQLLDFNKAENNSLALHAVEQDLIPVLTPIFESFLDEAERKQIRYDFASSREPIIVHADKDKLEIIAYNLLSNAFKFTPVGGQITVQLTYVSGVTPTCLITVSDSGKGIAEADKLKIFDRFYQVRQAEPGKYAGTGIGLAFVKDLVELHSGKIEVRDNQPSGTSFIVSLPALAQGAKDITLPVADPEDYTERDLAAVYEIIAEEDAVPVILVAEDNEALNHYICETLRPVGKVISCRDGRMARDNAIETIPDLVVSDIMMPEIDGYELCRIIKSDYRTSHIPIILLTARADDQSHIAGVGAGADNYLSKPFNPAVLVSYVKSLIDSRRKLKELFTQKFSIEPGEVEVALFSEEFVRNAIQYVEENMTRDDFSIDDLATRMNMSRSTFYRKLKAVTGMSGSDFIRLLRLKRSAQLLRTGEYNVSTAAYEAGFNDLKHFRKCFQEQFGVTPSAYIRGENEKN